MQKNTLQQQPNQKFALDIDEDAAQAELADSASFTKASWRLIIEDFGRSGPVNMALDQAIAESAAAGNVLPTLRFYRWDPPSVSLGRHQALADVDKYFGTFLGIVRRRAPTFYLLMSDHGTAYGEDGCFGHRLSHPTVWTVPYADGILETVE